MMKKKKLVILLLPLTLSACSSKVVLEYKAYSYDVKEDSFSTHSVIADGIVSRNGQYGTVSLPIEAVDGTDSISSLKEVSASRDAKYIFDNRGELKLLVVPLTFKNQVKEDLDKKKIVIENAFFGSPEKTSYESVASYYNKSSYGKVQIKGQVTDWHQCKYTLPEAIEESKRDGTGESVSRRIAADVADYLHELNDLHEIDLSEYDNDGDGNIDGVYIVYDYPQDENQNDRVPLFWAYFDKVSHNLDGMNKQYPYVSSYSWSSYFFTGKEAIKTGICDTNTYIHETGHLLGLDDYYNTNTKKGTSAGVYDKEHSGVFQPTGFMDMMDYNLGDHCSFSKYLLDWANPMVLENEGTVKLKSFTKTGDFILIPTMDSSYKKAWNGTPYDEYLLLEYFTPDGLNESYGFSSYSYLDGDLVQRVYKYPTRHGLRVYHVDARLAYFAAKSTSASKCWIDSPALTQWASINSGTKYVDFLNTNATLGTVDDNTQVLVHLLEASGNDDLLNGISASDSTLFGLGDSFGYDVYDSFIFNKNSKTGARYQSPFKFKITHLDSDEITIKFENNL